MTYGRDITAYAVKLVACEKYALLLRRNAVVLAFDWIDCACKRLRAYRPYLLEAAFGNRPDAKILGMEISTGSRRLNFTGVIDRIDPVAVKNVGRRKINLGF